jgi:hypothetical protein
MPLQISPNQAWYNSSQVRGRAFSIFLVFGLTLGLHLRGTFPNPLYQWFACADEPQTGEAYQFSVHIKASR